MINASEITKKSNSFFKNAQESVAGNFSAGHCLADRLVQLLGSWKFIVIQTIVLICWSIFNVVAWFEHWDPYPFILLNLFLSLQAAYAGPTIMMSQNRQAAFDRIEAHNDFLINQKAEKEIQFIIKQMQDQENKIHEIHHEMHQMLAELKKLNKETASA